MLRADHGFVLDAAAVDPAADLVFVGNPTNPTGVLHPRATLHALRRRGRVLVIDEAFADAVLGETESCIGPEMDSVLVVRSLTKTWGVAGLRAGYVIGDPRLVELMRRQQPHWSVSSPALTVMLATTSDRALRESAQATRDLASAREHLVGALERRGLRPVPGVAPSCSSKWATEYGKRCVTAVSPCGVATPSPACRIGGSASRCATRTPSTPS